MEKNRRTMQSGRGRAGSGQTVNAGAQADWRAYRESYDRIVDTMFRDMSRSSTAASVGGQCVFQLLAHHLAAVEMAQNVLRYVQQTAVRNEAAVLVKERTRGIWALRQVQPHCEQKTDAAGVLEAYRRRILPVQRTVVQALRQAPKTGRVDCDFVTAMLPHCRCAYALASETLRQGGISAELREVLEDVQRGQQQTYQRMQSLQRQLGCG